MSDDERIEQLELEVKVLQANNKGLKEKNKELEDTLKQTQNSWYEDTKVIEKQSKEIEGLKEDNKKKSIVIIEYQDLYEKLQDKIKAKIEELQEDIQYSANPLSIDNSKFVIKVLQSLLEKELIYE